MSKIKFLSIIFLGLSNFTSISSQDPVDISLGHPKSIEDILSSYRYKKIVKDVSRYRPSAEVLKKIKKNISEDKKSDLLLNWFNQKYKNLLRSLTFQKMIIVALQVVFVSLVPLVLLYPCSLLTTYLSKMNWVYTETDKAMRELIQKEKTSLLNKYNNDEKNANFKIDLNDFISSTKKEQLSTKISDKFKTYNPSIIMYTIRWYIAIGLLIQAALIMYKVIEYIIFRFKIFNEYRYFYRNPISNDPLALIERFYVKNYYRFAQDEDLYIRNLIENALLESRNSEEKKLGELDALIKAYVAIPYGFKRITYDQALIDKVFSTFRPEIKKLAEQIIGLMVIYSEAILEGKEELIEKIRTKPILLSGIPGTGKSEFIEAISKATGQKTIKLSVLKIEELRGESGKEGHYGEPSALAKAYIKASDENGRCTKSQIIVCEEIDQQIVHGISYFQELCDPRNYKIGDHYLQAIISLPIFKFATTNFIEKLPQPFLDRFQIMEVTDIPLKYKKIIIDSVIIPQWLALLLDETLNGSYGHYIDPQEAEEVLREGLYRYLEDNKHTGMRGIENEAQKIVANLIVKSLKNQDKKEALDEDIDKEEVDQLPLLNYVEAY